MIKFENKQIIIIDYNLDIEQLVNVKKEIKKQYYNNKITTEEQSSCWEILNGYQFSILEKSTSVEKENLINYLEILDNLKVLDLEQYTYLEFINMCKQYLVNSNEVEEKFKYLCNQYNKTYLLQLLWGEGFPKGHSDGYYIKGCEGKGEIFETYVIPREIFRDVTGKELDKNSKGFSI